MEYNDLPLWTDRSHAISDRALRFLRLAPRGPGPVRASGRQVVNIGARIRENLFRSLAIAAIVGSVLIYINHGDHLRYEPTCEYFWLKCGLTYLVPFAVSMVSVVLAGRRRTTRD